MSEEENSYIAVWMEDRSCLAPLCPAAHPQLRHCALLLGPALPPALGDHCELPSGLRVGWSSTSEGWCSGSPQPMASPTAQLSLPLTVLWGSFLPFYCAHAHTHTYIYLWQSFLDTLLLELLHAPLCCCNILCLFVLNAALHIGRDISAFFFFFFLVGLFVWERAGEDTAVKIKQPVVARLWR